MQENQVSTSMNQSVGDSAIQTEKRPLSAQAGRQLNFLVVLLSVLLFISVTISGFFAFQTQKLVKELQGIRNKEMVITEATTEPTIEPVATESSEIDSMAEWKTYTSAKFNFSFKYPSEMIYIYDQSDKYSETGGNGAMILVQNFDGSKPRIETENDFQIVLYIADKSGVFNLEDPQGEKVESTINGVKVIKSFTTQKMMLVPTAFFQSTPNKIAVQLSTPKSINKFWFNQILSTFKFLD